MYILFLFIGFISPFVLIYFSHPFLGLGQPLPLPSSPILPQHLLYLNIECRKGALCFALTYYVYSVVNMQRRGVSCSLQLTPPALLPASLTAAVQEVACRGRTATILATRGCIAITLLCCDATALP